MCSMHTVLCYAAPYIGLVAPAQQLIHIQQLHSIVIACRGTPNMT
jgi:hypothetical protein